MDDKSSLDFDWLDDDARDELVAIIPAVVDGFAPWLTSADVLDRAVNAVLGDGATDHARMRTRDDRSEAPPEYLHPFTTKGNWEPELNADRVFLLDATTMQAQRRFKFARMDGHISGHFRHPKTGEWYRLNRAYWSYHKGRGGDFPDVVRVASTVHLDASTFGALILFSEAEAAKWIASNLSALSEHAGPDATTYHEVEAAGPAMPARKVGRPSSLELVTRVYLKRLENGVALDNGSHEADAILKIFQDDEDLPEKHTPAFKTIHAHLATIRERLREKDAR